MDEDLRKAHLEAIKDPTQENILALGIAYLRSQAPPKDVLEIFGRRWFSSSTGNTYHTVRVHLNDELIGESDITYGHGNQFEETALEIAIKNAGLPPKSKSSEPPWRYAERIGIIYKPYVQDVRRKRDL